MIQHTQSVHHINEMVGSWTDWDLSNVGREQAKRIGVMLFGRLFPLHPFPEFGGAFANIFFEFLVEVIHVLVADLFGNLVHL